MLKGRSPTTCASSASTRSRRPATQLGLEGLGSSACPSGRSRCCGRLGRARPTRGDRAELDVEPRAATWAALSVGPRECPGANNCPKGDDCFAERGPPAKAATPTWSIVNTHLYGLHLASDGPMLPDHDVAVFDEAHEVADIITGHHRASSSSARRFTDAGARRRAHRRVRRARRRARDRAASGWRDVLAEPRGSRLRRGLPAEVAEAIADGADSASVASLEALRNVDDKLGADVATRKARVQPRGRRRWSTDIDAFVSPRADDVHVGRRRSASEHRLQLAPLDVGRHPRRAAVEPRAGRPRRSPPPVRGTPRTTARYGLPDTVVFTSATIPVGLARH